MIRFERAESSLEIARAIEPAASTSRTSEADWRSIDARLRHLARRRAALDAEEAQWLVAARREELHRHLGFATLLEYMERVLGYRPHAAAERLRVAEALATLPATRDALAAGRLSFSAVRELTRVATPTTEPVWLAAIAGRTLREIEPMIAGLRPGDLPGTPPEPGATRLTVRFEVSGETMALLRDARGALDDEAGERLDPDAVLAAMCRAVLDDRDDRDDRGDRGPARYQIAMMICAQCDRGWLDGGGTAFEVAPAVVERARCDAQPLGRVDAEVPARATQDIPAAVRRLVWRRDHGRCVVPGCRSSRHLDLHHVKHRSDGGDHRAGNLCLLCGAHHVAIHDGRLRLSGTVSSGLEFTHADGRPYGEPPPATPDEVEPDAALLADAHAALRGLGFSAHETREAVEAAGSHVGPRASLEALLRQALRELRGGSRPL